MSDDAEYLRNYLPDRLYTHPGKAGTYATIVGESEDVIGEIDVTARCKIAVSAFWVQDRSDFGTFKITKLVYHKTFGWRVDSHIQVNQFQLGQIKAILSVLSALDLSEATKARISLDNVNIGALGELLSSSKGAELICKLAEAPELQQDIYALASKRKALRDFEDLIGADRAEKDWQAFFEENQWIFGHGLTYVALDRAADSLTARTTGNEFDRAGKTVDALMRTRAEVSQFVFVEIKKDTTDLLRREPYRPGCWGVSAEVSNAVTQVQKTTFEFSRKRFRVVFKDQSGGDTGETAYSIEPKSFLVIGNTKELAGNDDKVACFELYRRNVTSPEILTFDELLYRARFIVENLARNESGAG